MKIAMIAPPFAQVPPSGYGGTERIVSLLTEGLVERGHDVTLFATGDSTTSASLRSYFDGPIIPYDERAGLLHQTMAIREIDSSFDIIHNHNWNYACVASFTDVPSVTTLHNDHTALFDLQAFRDLDLKFVAISESQANRLRSHKVNVDFVISNAIDLRAVRRVANPTRDYLAFLGNVAWYKGAHIAIQVALRAGIPLRIAGKLEGNYRSESFFEQNVRPYLKAGQVEFVGELDDAGKQEFLGHAIATLCPIQWEEPFGLVMLESMACGTPPIAFDRGAAREVVGNAGAVVESEGEMVRAVDAVRYIDPEICRDRAKRFDLPKMIDKYVDSYQKVAFAAKAAS